MLGASLRRFRTELCAREILRLMRIWDKQPVKFTGSGVGDVLSTSQPSLKRDQPLGTAKMFLFFLRDTLLEGTFSPVRFKSCFLGNKLLWCQWGRFLPRNPRGVRTDLCGIFTKSMHCTRWSVLKLIQAEANWRYFEGRSFPGWVLHLVKLCRGSHKDQLSLEDSHLSSCRFRWWLGAGLATMLQVQSRKDIYGNISCRVSIPSHSYGPCWPQSTGSISKHF